MIVLKHCCISRSFAPRLKINSWLGVFLLPRNFRNYQERKNYSSEVRWPTVLSKVKTLQQLFHCSERKAKVVVQQNPQLLDQIEEISTRVSNLSCLEIKPECLIKQLHILFLPRDELTERIKLIEQFNSKSYEALRLLNLPSQELHKLQSLFGNSRNKINQFSKLVNCNEMEACELFLKYPILKYSKPTTLKKKIDTLTEGGVSMEDLLKDLWVLTYTVDRLKERLKKAKEMKLSPIKPWMLRCSENTILRSWLNREENRAAMAPLSSTKEYLCERLDMSNWEAGAFEARHPPVMRVQVSKLKEMLDFLMAEGFTQGQIYNTPRILCHSQATIKQRLEILREKNYEPYTLSVLCKSEKNFRQFLMKLPATTIIGTLLEN